MSWFDDIDRNDMVSPMVNDDPDPSEEDPLFTELDEPEEF